MFTRPLLIAVLVLAPSVAGAQGFGGPFRGLFGRAPERVGKEYTALEFRSAIGGQFEPAILADPAATELAPPNAAAVGVSSGLTFERRRDRMRLAVYGNGVHQQQQRPAFSATSYGTGGLLVVQVATRLSLNADTSYSRSPFFRLGPATADVALPPLSLPGDTYAARALDNNTLDATAGFSSPYSQRSTLSASVSRRATRFAAEPDKDVEVWGARGRWTRKLTRDLAARIGYGREEIRATAFSPRFVHEVIDVGVDVDREFSLTRRTALAFNTQTSMVRENAGERRYRLNGGIVVTRAFERTWAAALSATRNTEFLPGFLQPIFSDAVSGTVSGMLAPRIEWSGALAASRGRIGFENLGTFVTYRGTSRLSAGVTRYLGLYAEYSYYSYALPAGSTSIAVLPQLSRQALSVGLSAYVPIFTRMRNAS